LSNKLLTDIVESCKTRNKQCVDFIRCDQ